MTPAVAHADLTERLLRRFLLLCESPRTQRRVLGLVQASVSDQAAGRRFYALVNRAVLHPLARVLKVESSAVRLELVGSQLVGLAMLRYVLRVEPIASLDIDELVRLMAPSLRHSLTGGGPAPAGPQTPVEPCACRTLEPLTVPW